MVTGSLERTPYPSDGLDAEYGMEMLNVETGASNTLIKPFFRRNTEKFLQWNSMRSNQEFLLYSELL